MTQSCIDQHIHQSIECPVCCIDQAVEDTGACMEYLLQHKLLETLCTLGKAQVTVLQRPPQGYALSLIQ